jgi:CheY-like chemotaxis protein/nitrogen-specific signal transduction histidine kinase
MSPASSEKRDQETTASTSHEAQALDSLGIVVGEIAHDFNNILSLIFGYVEMALSEIPEGQRARSDLEHVLAAGDRAKELVARILTYSNRARLKKQELDLRKPLQTALRNIKDRLPQDVKLEAHITHDAAAVVANDIEIVQIVTNLCSNAVQSLGGKKGVIAVSLEIIDQNSPFHAKHPGLTRDSYAVLTVTDNGCGMDLSTLAKIYTPFFTTHRGSGRGESRAGLGLTTVYNIVTSMEGLIFVNSVPGEGTTFELCLPLTTSVAAVMAQPQRPVEAVKREKNVLFIDDEPAITEMASHILSHSGYKATFFNDGNEALQHFSSNPHAYDIVITDLIMPIISGSEVATRCADINPNIPIILTTGFSEKISLASCRKWGVTAVITKPFSIQQLLATLEELTKS